MKKKSAQKFQKSKKRGKNISEVEVTHISKFGIWVLVNDREFFLPYDQFPWFRKAVIEQIHDVQIYHNHHLHRPRLDVDLDLLRMENPDLYPLVSAYNAGSG